MVGTILLDQSRTISAASIQENLVSFDLSLNKRLI